MQQQRSTRLDPVLVDRGDGDPRDIESQRALAAVPVAVDEYRHALARSLEASRRHDQLSLRLQAAASARALLHVLFGLEHRWPPDVDDVADELGPIEAAQGWPAGYLGWALLQLHRDPAPRRQLELARRVERLLVSRGLAADEDAGGRTLAAGPSSASGAVGSAETLGA